MGSRWKSRPTKWGPGTDGPVWCGRPGRWVFPLNAAGVRVAEWFYSKYGGCPAKCVAGFAPKLYRTAHDLLGRDGVESAAGEAVVKGAAQYRPDTPDLSGDAGTYLVACVYRAIQREVKRVVDERADSFVVQEPENEDGVSILDDTAGFDPDPADGVEVSEWRERLADAARFLPTRERVAVLGNVVLGKSLREIGELYGVSREMARHLVVRGLERMQLRLFKVNRHTSVDGSTLPPPRSVRCLPTRRSNATTR